MKKGVICLLFYGLFLMNAAFAHFDYGMPPAPPDKKTDKNEAKIDEYLDTRLHFTAEQKEHIKQNRQVFKKNMEKIVKQMQNLHDDIRDVYISGIPKYQADIRTASKKAQLVILNQNARWLKDEHRKGFEAILSDEQKIEFEKIRKEFVPHKYQPPR